MPEQKVSATAVQDPRAFPVQRGPRPSAPAPAGQSAGRAHLLMSRFGSSTTQTEKAWCWVLEKAPESPLDCKEIQPVHPKGNQP